MDLKGRKCKPCEGGTKPMGRKEASKYLKFANGWKLSSNRILTDRKFRDFNEAIRFVNNVGRIAESEGHHPDIYLHSWNRVRLTLYTHAIKGLSINDFIVAAKINELK